MTFNNPYINGLGNIVGNHNTVNITAGETVAIHMSTDEFMGIIRDAELYRAFGEKTLEYAQKWEALHPKQREVLSEYDPSELIISPNWQ